MKKIIMLIAAAAFLSLYSCSEEEHCEDCKAVTKDKNTGEKVDEDAAENYCGSTLDAKEDEYVVVGDDSTYYECSE
jgi:hypothetical protein